MNSSKNFNCSTTCVGMHADIQWHEYKIEDEMEDSESVHSVDTDFMDKYEEASAKLLKRVAFLEKELKMLKRGFGITEKWLEKYKMLTAEYRKFKAKNVKHFRFKLDSNSGTFGEIRIFLFAYSIFKFRKRTATFTPPIGGDLLCHSQLRRHRERQEDQDGGPAESHWRHHGTPHWFLHHQWGGDRFLSLQVRASHVLTRIITTNVEFLFQTG